MLMIFHWFNFKTDEFILLSYQQQNKVSCFLWLIFAFVLLHLYAISFHPMKMHSNTNTCRTKAALYVKKSHLYLLLFVISTPSFICLAAHDSLSEQVSIVKYLNFIRRWDLKCKYF